MPARRIDVSKSTRMGTKRMGEAPPSLHLTFVAHPERSELMKRIYNEVRLYGSIIKDASLHDMREASEAMEVPNKAGVRAYYTQTTGRPTKYTSLNIHMLPMTEAEVEAHNLKVKMDGERYLELKAKLGRGEPVDIKEYYLAKFGADEQKLAFSMDKVEKQLAALEKYLLGNGGTDEVLGELKNVKKHSAAISAMAGESGVGTGAWFEKYANEIGEVIGNDEGLAAFRNGTHEKTERVKHLLADMYKISHSIPVNPFTIAIDEEDIFNLRKTVIRLTNYATGKSPLYSINYEASTQTAGERNKGDYEGVYKMHSLVSKPYGRIASAAIDNYSPVRTTAPEKGFLLNVPEWESPMVLNDPQSNIQFILGSDYGGSQKKGVMTLSQTAHQLDGRGIGVHASLKIYRLVDKPEQPERVEFWRECRLKNRMIDYINKYPDTLISTKTALVAGLSKTGKTTIATEKHTNQLDGKYEKSIPVQDDQLLIDLPKTIAGEGFALLSEETVRGQEMQFYLQTSGFHKEENKSRREAVLRGGRDSMTENIPVDSATGMLVWDESTHKARTENPRAFVKISNLPGTSGNPNVHGLDYIFFLSKGDLPIVQKLSSPKEVASFYALGETVKAAGATVDQKKDEFARKPGFTDFIPPGGFMDQNIELLHFLLESDSKIQAYVLNTGEVGSKQSGKVKVRPEDTTHAILSVLTGDAEFKYDPNTGTEVPVHLGGVDLKKFDPYVIHKPGEYEKLMQETNTERNFFLEFHFPDLFKRGIIGIGKS